MKKLSFTIFILFMTSLVPVFVSAAYNDVTLTTSTVLSVGSYTLNITGSSAVVSSIVVNPSNIVVTMQAGSSLQVTSPTFNQLTVDNQSLVSTNTCSTNSSVLTLSSPSSSGTVTVTPTATICSTASTPPSTTVVGNGALVGLITTTPAVPTIATSTVDIATTPTSLQSEIAQLLAEVQALEAQLPVSSSLTSTSSGQASLFTHNLTLGSVGGDVQALQHYLNTHGYPIAITGLGSLGHETTKFGALTYAAVKVLQKSVGLPSTGYFGPLTRGYVNGH